jgi:glutathione S-transferase
MRSASLTLVIGNKNLSSWSLRPWLLLRHFGVPFNEVLLKLDTAEFKDQVRKFSPAGKVPVLTHGDLRLWDSLAISEYVNEVFLQGKGWPADPVKRANARAIVCEMHSSFAALRKQMSMNLQRQASPVNLDADAQADVARVQEIWQQARAVAVGGPFLFGEFCIADAFYAPVATRFTNYAVTMDAVSTDYVKSLYALAAMKEWIAAALSES